MEQFTVSESMLVWTWGVEFERWLCLEGVRLKKLRSRICPRL
jgi:hypothetical protein